MLCENYLNYQKDINNKFIYSKSYILKPGEYFENKFDKNPVFLFVNTGNLITITESEKIILCPPKNCFFSLRHELKLNPSNSAQQFTIIEFKSELKNIVMEEITNAVEPFYTDFFEKSNLLLDFPLNIDIIDILENFYKTSNDLIVNFNYLELKTNTLQIITHIFKTILFQNYKFLDSVATSSTKFYLILKNIFENEIPLDDSLILYDFDKDHFNSILKTFTQIDFNTYKEKLQKKGS